MAGVPETPEQLFGRPCAFHAPAKHAKIHARPTHFRGREMKAYMCVICGFVYEEAKGVPDQGIAPGTLWKDVPENWTCPDCGAPKSDFEMVEI
jgi:rubredoxin